MYACNNLCISLLLCGVFVICCWAKCRKHVYANKAFFLSHFFCFVCTPGRRSAIVPQHRSGIHWHCVLQRIPGHLVKDITYVSYVFQCHWTMFPANMLSSLALATPVPFVGKLGLISQQWKVTWKQSIFHLRRDTHVKYVSRLTDQSIPLPVICQLTIG